jgi:hypothetical protein
MIAYLSKQTKMLQGAEETSKQRGAALDAIFLLHYRATALLSGGSLEIPVHVD